MIKTLETPSLAVLACLLFVLTGCLGSGGSSSSGTTTDTTAPITTAAPSVASTTATLTTLSATIDKDGVGFWLAQAASAVAPTVATMQTSGTPFVMTANTAASTSVTGLTASTDFRIYFVARDWSGNTQANVQSVAVTTPAVDVIPDAFAFTDQAGVAYGTLTESDAITVSGLNTTVGIAVTGGEYQIDGGNWTSVVGTISDGHTVKVRHTSSAYYFTDTNTTLTIGGMSDTFTTRTPIGGGYVYQGGVLWMPVSGTQSWYSAYMLCASSTINGQTGWYLPYQSQLESLYSSGAMNNQGWTLGETWTSTTDSGNGYYVNLSTGSVNSSLLTYYQYVTCVHNR
jgi:hypothetical protein